MSDRPSTECKERHQGHLCVLGDHGNRPHKCLCDYAWVNAHVYKPLGAGCVVCWCGADKSAAIHSVKGRKK